MDAKQVNDETKQGVEAYLHYHWYETPSESVILIFDFSFMTQEANERIC